METERATTGLSLSQQNIWNVEQALPGTPVNLVCAAVRIQGRFDVSALKKGLNAAVEADGMLRTRLTLKDGKPCQYTVPFRQEQYRVFDFSRSDEKSFGNWEETVARETMPLLDSPLYRFDIFRLGEDRGGVLVRVHHILTDGWSQVLLENRLAAGYLDALAGKPVSLASPPDYSVHIQAEEEYLRSPAAESDRVYWEEKLRGMTEPVSVKEVRGAAVSPVGRRLSFTLPETLNRAVERFCTENRIAPFAVFYMALAIYLRRTSGAETICVGVPIYNRADFLEKQMSGMFVSTIPFLCDLDEDWSFEEFRQHMEEEWFDLLRHQKLPFSEITELAKKSRPGLRELFHIVLSYQNGRLMKNEDASVTFSGRWHYSGYQAEPLLIHVSGLESAFRFSVDYDYQTQMFTEEEILRLHGTLMRLVAAALEDPEKPVWSLPLLSREEKEQVLFGFNRTDRPLPEAGFAETLDAAVREYPERVALISGGRRERYGELWNRAKCVAREIQRRAPGRGLVAVSLKKGFSLIESMLGAALAGDAWLILPPELPDARKAFILEQSGAALLIAEKPIPSAEPPFLPPDGAEIVPDCPFVPEKTGPCDLAYVVYTSGSTGQPKGVEIAQENLMNFAAAMKPLYGHRGVLSLCSVGFDVFILESVVSLLNGCTVILAADREQEDPVALARLIQSYAVDFLALTPSRLRAYLQCPEFVSALRRVESIVCGGESISGDLIRHLGEITGAKLYNQYGPSETTVGVSVKLLTGALHITAGRPMPNCRLYVLDRHRQPLPTGVDGELYIGGKCVGRGYRGAPELTAESFFDSPFEPGERLYKTGDVACWKTDGEIVIRGRKDDQVKLRGLRIEPQEIAECLQRYPDIREAAVKVVTGRGNPYLAAYYTSEREFSPAELLRFLAQYLPEYMLPARFVRMARMPVSPSGKTEVRRLPDPVEQRSGRLPENSRQRVLLKIFREVLGRDEMDIDSDYFLSGGDSLNAVETICRVEAETGTALKTADLYTLRTVRNLDEGMQGASSPEKEGELSPAPPMASYPLTGVQQNLFVQTMLDKGGVSYNMPGAFRLGKNVDTDRLKTALGALPEQEELLRTSFAFEGREARQTVHDRAELTVEEITAASLADAEKQFVRPFDLTRAPLMRAALWRDGDGAVLLIDMHHIISDGLSSRLLMKRLDEAYRGETLAHPSVFYKDYAVWLEQQHSGDAGSAYWAEALSGAPQPLALPADFPRKKEFDFAGGRLELALGDELSARCREFCAKNNLSSFMLLSGVFGILLSRLSGKEDVLVGTPVSGRTRSELWNMFGAFINTLPLRLTPKASLSAGEYFRGVRDSVIGMLDHQNVGLEDLISLTGAKRTLSGNALYSVLFSCRPVSGEEFCLGGEKLDYLPIGTGTAKFDITLEASEGEHGTVLTMEYASSLFAAETAALWARCYRELLVSVVSGRDCALTDLPALSGRDRMELLETPRYLRMPYVNLCLDQLFDRMEEILPDSPAVYAGEEVVTYRELRERAEDCAAQLEEEGAKRGDTVAVALRRTPDVFAAILGVLKAGCAYIPMLPSLPEERLRYMLEVSGAKLLLCDRATAAEMPETLPCRIVVLERKGRTFTPVPGRSTEDDIHILFTSGTTGKPKGVVLPHKAIANLLADMRAKYDGLDGNVLCVSSLLFDTFLMDSLLPITAGHAAVLADEEEMMLPWKLAELIEKKNVRAAFMTPSRWQMCLANEPFFAAAGRLSHAMVGGEAVSRELLERFQAAGCRKVTEFYGPTETAIYVTSVDVTGKNRPLIGRAIPNCRVYLLNAELRPVLPTAVGELYIAGECLAKGYVGRPDLTEQQFVPDPFFPGERMYRSGDLARLTADGNLEFIGREDMQVKLNGQRVELSEITGAILRTGYAAEAAVVPVRKKDDSMELRAFFVPAEGRAADAASLKRALEELLPRYMIPSTLLPLDTLPKTATGKTDVQALLALPVGAEGPEPVLAAAGTPEERITRVWEDILGRKGLSPEGSFFDQGGTSLAALNVLGQYFKNGWKISLGEFYDHPTITEQAALLENAPAESGKTEKEETEKTQETAAASAQTSVSVLTPAAEIAEKRDVFVTGATGFLGAHLIREFVDAGRTCVCLVRGGSRERLESVLAFYFGKDWVQENGGRLEVAAGELALPLFGFGEAALMGYAKRVSAVVHAAADVRHFAGEAEMTRTNVEGTRQAAALAARCGAMLLHVSTLSVSGDRLTGDPDRSVPFTEEDFDIGQNWQDNVYVKTKFLAEQAVLEAAKDGLRAKIFRTGALVGRSTDGRFQRRPETNALYLQLRGLQELDCLPEAYAGLKLTLSAVDLTAKAILALADGKNMVYHVSDTHPVALRDMMAALQHPMREVPPSEFERQIVAAFAKVSPEELAPVIELWNRMPENRQKIVFSADKTAEALRSRGFVWPVPDIPVLLKEFRKEAHHDL